MKNLVNLSMQNLSERIGGLMSKDKDRSSEANNEQPSRRHLTIEVKPIKQSQNDINPIDQDEDMNSNSFVEKNIKSFKTSPKNLNSDIREFLDARPKYNN